MADSVFNLNEFFSGDQRQSSVGVFETGRFFAVWHDNSGEYTSSADGDAVVGRMFDYDGAPLTDTFQVNVGTDVNSSTNPSVAVSTEVPYQMLAVWEQPNTAEYGDGDGLGIFGQIIDSSGDLHATPFQINSFVVGNQVHPKVTAL